MKILKQNGFSLVELLIATGIGGALVLGIASILMTAFTQSMVITDGAEAEIDEMRAVNFLQDVFSQAINVRYWGPGDLNGYTGTDGQLREFDSDTLWADPRSTYPLAVFWREAFNSTDVALVGKSSDLRRTAIYFQKPAPPSGSSRSTWGVVYASLGSGATPL
ncbi:MAG: prepilin-type N-terminal cleavage/methylation domain-containing protein, partial [Bdellovibrionota bacterium]